MYSVWAKVYEELFLRSFLNNERSPMIGKIDTIIMDVPKANHLKALMVTPRTANSGISVGNRLTRTVNVTFST